MGHVLGRQYNDIWSLLKSLSWVGFFWSLTKCQTCDKCFMRHEQSFHLSSSPHLHFTPLYDYSKLSLEEEYETKADLVLGDPEDCSRITSPKALPGPFKEYLGDRMKSSNPEVSLSIEMYPFRKLDQDNPTLNHYKKPYDRAFLPLALASVLAFQSS